MNKLMLHCGAEPIGVDQLSEIPLPEATGTYTPIAHIDLIENIRDIAPRFLDGWHYDSEEYGVTKDGNRMFFLHRYKNGVEDYGLVVAGRNSYDKSMSAGLAIGANVFICDNLAFTGDIVVMRRHTGEAGKQLMASIIGAIIANFSDFKTFGEDFHTMRESRITDQVGHRMLGQLAGAKILSPTMFNEAMRQWHEPQHEAFKPRTMWSLYNSCTEVIKRVPMERTFGVYKGLHDQMMSSIRTWIYQ